MEDQPGPEVELGPLQTICEGESITLRANATGNNLSYQWSNGSSRANQKVTPILDGYANQTFNYRITVTDENGCSATDLVSVRVLSVPQVITAVNHPNNGANGSITFSFENHPKHTKMQFSLDGEQGTYQEASDALGSFSIDNLGIGNYDAWVKWDDDSCPVDLGVIRLRSDGTCPEIAATVSSVKICEGESIVLNVNTSKGWPTLGTMEQPRLLRRLLHNSTLMRID